MAPKQGSSQKRSSRNSSSGNKGEIEIGELSGISGEVNIAAGDIIKTIQTYYERELTPGEVIEKDLKLESHRLAHGLQEYLERLQRQVSTPVPTDPYKGLNPYTLSDAEDFFGREQALNDLHKAMKRGKLTILQAESGAGKTSLLQAGLIPQLILEKHLAILLRPQFDNPTLIIKKCFLGDLELTPKLAHTPLVDFLRRVVEIIGVSTNLYLILDQFEEFFSKHTLEEDRQVFIRDLAQCMNDVTLNVHWVISITSDAFGQLGKLEPLISNPFLNVQSLYLFNRQEATEVIAKPAQKHGLVLQEGLLDCLLDDLGQHKDAPIAPTQIQLVCLALYEDLQGHESIFTLTQYEEKGRVEGILRGYVGKVLRHHLPPEERAPAYKVFEVLVTSEKKRILRGKSEIEIALTNKGISPELADSTLDHLVNRRLIRRLGDYPEHIQYEIVHDYLLREIEIDEDLRKVKEAEELLEQSLRIWKKRGEISLTLGALKNINPLINKLYLSIEQKELLLVTALEYNYQISRLAKTLTKEERSALVAKCIKALKENQGNPNLAYKLLWLLRSDLPADFQSRVFVWKVRTSLPKIAIALALSLLVLFALTQLPNKLVEWTGFSTEWEPIQGFVSECGIGSYPPNLLIAHDPTDTRHVLVTGEGMENICYTQDSAYSWNNVLSLPVDNPTSLSTNNKRIYVSSRSGAYFKNSYVEDWVKVNIPQKYANQEILSISVDITNPLEVYLTLRPLSIIVSSDGGNTWKDINTEDIQGNITAFGSNKNYMIVTTDQGYWFKKKGDNDWSQYKNSLTKSLPLAKSISVFNFDEPDFLLATDEGKVWSVFLNEDNGLYWEGTWPNKIYHISAFYTSWYASGPQGLYCNESWDISNFEWWRWKFDIFPPCN